MNNVQHYRAKVGVGQPRLAKESGCSQPTISSIEKGGSTSVDLARRIAAALARLGAVNDSGRPVSLDDVFPPISELARAAKTA